MTADSLASVRELATPNSQTGELKMQTSLDSLRRAESAITNDQPPAAYPGISPPIWQSRSSSFVSHWRPIHALFTALVEPLLPRTIVICRQYPHAHSTFSSLNGEGITALIFVPLHFTYGGSVYAC